MPDNKAPASINEMLESPWTGLRDDLVLHKGPNTPYGELTWYLEDPLSGQFYQLGYVEGEFFLRLTAEPTLESAIQRLLQETGLRPSVEEMVQFIKLLQKEQLTKTTLSSEKTEKKPESPKEPSLWSRLMYGYVYFRIPLFRPDAFLTKAYPWVKHLWSTPAKYFYTLSALVGILLTLQQLDLYLHSFSHLLTPRGAFWFFICLAGIKIAHELGHAFIAKSLGLHIRSMGIVLIVLWPILYTDATEAWRLKDRNKRFKIDRAGLMVEFSVAGLSLLLWGILPEGTLKSLFFFLSSTSLISSLLINVNPFMRFDGYYLLMDVWGIDNLQPRALALMGYKIRRFLFDWQTPPPEYHPHGTALVLYAIGVVVYRVFVVLGIGLAVYHLFFKTLGIILLLVEFWVFLLLPVVRGIKYVFKNKQYIGKRQKLARTWAIIGGIFFLLSIPLPTIEVTPAMVLSANHTPVFSPDSGQLVSALPEAGLPVQKDQLLASLKSPNLERELQMAQYDLHIVDTKIFLLSSGGEEGGYRNWLLAEKERLTAQVEKLTESKAQLQIRSPSNGVVMDLNKDLYPFDWLKKSTYLFAVATPNQHQAKAFVHEHHIESLTKAAPTEGELHCSDLETPVLEAKLIEQTPFPVNELPNDSLYDFAGGPIVSQSAGQDKRFYPRNAHFPFLFSIEEVPPHLAHGTPCWMWIKSEPRSIFSKWGRAIANWFTKEGFF